MTLVLVVVVAAAGFVAGVLVGRRNKNKVEVAVAAGEAVIKKIEAAVEKK